MAEKTEEISKNWRIFNFTLSRSPDCDLGSGHMTPSCISHNSTSTHTKFHSNWKNFLWMDVWTSDRLY